MSILKRCKTCGQEFTAIAGQAYCRNPCKPPSITERAAREIPCVECGTVFKPKGGQQRCEECRPKPWAPSMQVCVGCGELYLRQAPAQRYCKPQCRPSPPHKVIERRACEGCGEEFEPNNGKHRFCKPECNPHNQPKGRTRKPPISRECEECGKTWHPSSEIVQARLCFECRESKRTRHAYSRKKAWRAAVLARAEHACEECGRSATETGAPLHAHHLVPTSQGGLNTLDNGKALCIDCHAKTHDGAMGGATFQPETATLADLIAERISAAITADLDDLKSRMSALEELANRY